MLLYLPSLAQNSDINGNAFPVHLGPYEDSK